MEVDKVNYVFRDKKRCISWRPNGYRLKCCIAGDFQESHFQQERNKKGSAELTLPWFQKMEDY